MKVGQPSFTSGELDPALHARADLQLYKTGLETCLNYVVLPQGGARNRPGTAFKGQVKGDAQARLIPFAYNDDDSYILEFTAAAMRVYRNGTVVETAPGTPYELSHGLTWAQVSGMDFEQNADTLVLTHYTFDPKKLTRSDHDNWSLDTFTYVPAIAAPTGLSGSGGSGTSYTYVVTAVDAATFEESLPSSSTTMAEDGGTLTWTAVTGAQKYNIYKRENGIFGFIGQAEGTSFKDTKLIAETEDTPPASTDPFADTDQFPTCVTFHEQRLIMGGANPQRVNTSQTGNLYNFSVSAPAKDGDALTLDLVTNRIATIRYLVSQLDLLVFTAGAEMRISSGDNPFVLENLSRKTQSDYGCEIGLKPRVVGDKILFVQRGGKSIRDFAYSLEADKFTGGDLSVIAKHMFNGRSIAAWDYANEPDPIIWMVMSDGTLVALTIAPEHDVLAFTRHELEGGTVEDVAVVPEGLSTGVYFIVKRTIDGSEVRYIERLNEWGHDAESDAAFLDCSVAYDIGAGGTSQLTGLDHLEGETITALVGGDVITDLTVSSGTVDLGRTYTSTYGIAGIGYTSRMKTLEPPIPDAYGNEMSVARVQIRTLNTRGVWAGPTVDEMTERPTRDAEDWGEPNENITGIVEVVIEPSWSQRGKVVVEQRDPLPSFILAVVPDVEPGG